MLSSRVRYRPLIGLLAGLVLLACSKRPAPVSRQGLPWYEDTPEAALAAARAENKLVLVDLWAPWCHSCLSMQNFVLTAENLPQITNRFVLLAVDTERAENAPFLQALPVAVWPTFYVVNSERQVFGRWLGSAAPAQLARFLSESERSAQLEGSERLPESDPSAQLRSGDAFAMRGEHLPAADAYARALALAPPDWPRRPETLVAQITALSKAKADARCLELARAGMQQTGSAASASDFASYALGCAERVPADALALEVRRGVEERLTPLCQQGTPELAPDDRAD
ncbi:MAG TPA: thioredoxin family protein, partial [Polyangiaceae bacterium]|nr:thioredoxin family protein [Polyangiaceae bacterium]